MSLGQRALVLVGGAALATAAVACRQVDEARTPTGAVRAFTRAADLRSAARDRERVCSLIGPRTRARLQETARLATQQAGARRPFEWKDMLIIGMARPRYDLDDVRVVEANDRHALVEVRGPGGARETVAVVREGELWKIELPAPPAERPASAPTTTSQPGSAPVR
ncbi:MAG: hypothetical protein HY906_18635 [Deltaproteobacteria bacterium]|nr:hypothetical protein [Deltaproteobacteria bacterium]